MNAGTGKRDGGSDVVPFAQVMQEHGMVAPLALDASIRKALAGNSSTSSEEVLKAAENLLDKVLTTQCDSRQAALDLLTVDALVTRAMQIAARDSKLLAECPELAMRRIAAK